jgi:hypothetical protein
MQFFERENIERIKYIVEIVAILVGGWWAYNTFSKVTEPTLAIHGKTESTLDWEKPANKNYIHAEFYASLENTGTSSFTIKKARLRGWIFDDTPPAAGMIAKFRDVNQIAMCRQPFFDTTFTKRTGSNMVVGPPFLGVYVQNSLWTDNFEFVMMKSNLNRLVLFLMEYYQDVDDTIAYDYTYHWGYVGGLDNCDAKGPKKSPQKD